MKKSHGLTVVGTSLLLAAVNSHAQSSNKFYLNADLGAAFTQNSTVHSSFYTGGDVKFDPGLNANLGVGYNLTKSFAVELDAGVVWNTVNSINGNTLSVFSADGELYQIPVMVNGIYKVPLKGPFKPYVGVGAGMVVGIFGGSHIPGLYFPGASAQFSSTDEVFAYQATVGVKYSVSQHLDLGVAYKFLGTTDYSWFDNNANFNIDGTMTHIVMATLSWRF